MKKLLFFSSLVLFFSCSEPTSTSSNSDVASAETEEASMSIGSEEYVTLHAKSIELLANMDIDAWAEMLADDMEYNFPDGDLDTRTSLKGKEEVVAWWKNWKETAGIKSMSFTNPTYLPVHTKEAPTASDVKGNFVISYVSNTMELENGNTVKLRMNMNTHFNDDNKIDRMFSYYDRTPIIQAMGGNILDSE